MASRKINQEIEKCFKAVNIGVEAFDEQYSKYEQSTNASQKERLVDAIKKECKKLQRLRDQIKTWAAGNEVKDKQPLLDKRELIETKMEAFKAVEKEMKTKAFSKEGLSAASKLDPKDKDRSEVTQFLEEMIESLSQQMEKLEAEIEQKTAQGRKAKKDTAIKEQVTELEERATKHKFHTEKLELLLRNVENENLEAQQVRDIEEGIKDYVDNNEDVDFIEDEFLYDDLNLDEEGGAFTGAAGLEKTTSQDQAFEEPLEQTTSSEGAGASLPKAKPKAPVDNVAAAPNRRPSQQIKSPLPSLASLNAPQPSVSAAPKDHMKPAPPPAKAGEPLKYAFAAAAAANADKAGIGIAPLPAPAGANQSPATQQAVPAASIRSSSTNSPAVQTASLANTSQELKSAIPPSAASDKASSPAVKSPVPSHSDLSATSPAISAAQVAEAAQSEIRPPLPTQNGTNDDSAQRHSGTSSREPPQPWQTNGVSQDEEEQSIYHLPSSLQELVDSYNAVKENVPPVTSPEHHRALAASCANRPDVVDMDKPRHYRPKNPSLYTPPHYPQEPLPIFDDPRLYTKIDSDALFYSFYYRQGTLQQYLAAKSLKSQSWRFHKQYQTWFQRHEEPKNITEEFEQGTYRFFDYESTWMNRRKADFKFQYKFLEDDL